MSGSSVDQQFYSDVEAGFVASAGAMTTDLSEQLCLVDITAGVKADPIVALIKSAEDEAERWKKEAAEYTALQRSAERRADALKSWLKDELISRNLVKVDGPRYGVTLCDSPVSIKWPGKPDELPQYLQRHKIELDAPLAKFLYNAGKLPSGFEVSRGKHLLIK